MKDAQNKIITSQKAFVIHIYGLHHYKRELSNFSFTEYINSSKNFNVGSLGGTTNIQTIFFFNLHNPSSRTMAATLRASTACTGITLPTFTLEEKGKGGTNSNR
jgi:hypothetical protein